MSEPGGISAGEVGGIVAGAVALLAAFGKGVSWLLPWLAARGDRREAELERREADLDEHEIAYRKRIEGELATIKASFEDLQKKNAALWRAFEFLASAERIRDPKSPNLHMAEQVLATVFPLDLVRPAAFTASLVELDEKMSGGEAA